jgi:integrase
LADEYQAWARDNLRAWRRNLTPLGHLRWFFAGRTIREITPWLIERYKQERAKALVRKRPIRPTTINRELACLKRVFNLGIQWGKTESNPVREVKFFREDGRRERVLSPAEIGNLLVACTDHSRPMVMLALHTGMRRGEILGLTWDRVDLLNDVITLMRTKSGKPRRVPLNEVLRELLNGLPRDGAYVFGGEQPFGSIKTAWLAACRRAGLTGVRFHDLRHTWASYAVLAGTDLRTVQEVGGWSSLALVERYTHPSSEAKRRAVEAVSTLLAARNGHHMDTTASAAGDPVAVSVG